MLAGVKSHHRILGLLCALLCGHPVAVRSAMVEAGAGYTNDFSARPLAVDWSTRSFGSAGTTGAGEITTVAGLDAAVQTNRASFITAQCGSSTGDPPAGSATAVWSTGGYLQTRPTQCAATLLLATLTNNTGASVGVVRLSYELVTNRASLAAEEVRGHRVYYSLAGAPNTWSNIAALSQTAAGPLSVDLELPGGWASGAPLYLLWADDNGSGSPDDANQIDNFSVRLPGGEPPGPACVLVSPANGQSFGAPANLTLTAAAHPGPEASLTGVGFFETTLGFIGSSLIAPFSHSLELGPGTYRFYAVATNSLAVVVFSSTNLVTVVSGTVIRGPYLGCRGATNVTIRWRTAESMVGRVRYGTDPAHLTACADDPSNRTDHVVALTGLQPETKYYYSIGSTIETLQAGADYYFFTAPPAGVSRPARIWFLSDFGRVDATQSAVRGAALNFFQSTGRDPDVWLGGGDNDQGNGTDAEFQSTVFNVYSNILCRQPFFPTGGNHDGLPASALWSIFSLPTNGALGGVPANAPYYYSFNYGDIHFLCLDSENSSRLAGGPMLSWLEQDLAANTQRWTIAYWHEPPYSKVFYDSDTDANCREMRENAVPLLEAYGVDVVLCGHAHSLQRTWLINGHYGLAATFNNAHKLDGGDGRVDGSGAYLKTGAGGAVYAVAPAGCGLTRTGSAHPACLFTINSTAGFLVLDVNSNRLDFQMVTSTGAIGDYFTILKGASQLAPPARPATLTAAAGGSAVNLSWVNNATNEAGYSLECSVNGAPFREIARPGANLTGYAHSEFNPAHAYYYRLRSWNNAGYSEYTDFASVTPAGPLQIDQQPLNLASLPGQAVLFSVLARGAAPITYQWYFAGAPLDGQTNQVLRLYQVTDTHAGQYTVVIANGGAPLASQPATLTLTDRAWPLELREAPRAAQGVFSAVFRGTVGAGYTLEAKDSLDASLWRTVGWLSVPATGTLQFQDQVGAATQRFYRLVGP